MVIPHPAPGDTTLHPLRRRSQPIPLVLVALTTTITSILLLSNFKGMGRFCEATTIVC